MRVVVLSDTHAPRFWKPRSACSPSASIPLTVARQLDGADLILHAGDVCTVDVLEQLSAFAPVRAVLGNNDGPDVAAWGAPETLEFEVDGLSVAMIHDSGAKQGRLHRMRRRFPAADLVVFGHSHIPLDESDGGFRILNPGSPTDKRRQPHGTLIVLDVAEGVVRSTRLVEVS